MSSSFTPSEMCEQIHFNTELPFNEAIAVFDSFYLSIAREHSIPYSDSVFTECLHAKNWLKIKRRFPIRLEYIKNTLLCCDKNAVLFTEGGTEAYLLRYAQTVHGVRPDVTIISRMHFFDDSYIEHLSKHPVIGSCINASKGSILSVEERGKAVYYALKRSGFTLNQENGCGCYEFPIDSCANSFLIKKDLPLSRLEEALMTYNLLKDSPFSFEEAKRFASLKHEYPEDYFVQDELHNYFSNSFMAAHHLLDNDTLIYSPQEIYDVLLHPFDDFNDMEATTLFQRYVYTAFFDLPDSLIIEKKIRENWERIKSSIFNSDSFFIATEEKLFGKKE
jgi:hypothetical protein